MLGADYDCSTKMAVGAYLAKGGDVFELTGGGWLATNNTVVNTCSCNLSFS